MTWGSLLTGAGVVALALVLGACLFKLVHSRIDRTPKPLEEIGDRLRLDLDKLAAAAGAVLAWLILVIAAAYDGWTQSATLLLMTATAVATVVAVILLALGIGTGMLVAVVTGLVAGALIFSLRFEYLERALEPLRPLGFTFGEYRITLVGVLGATIALIVLYGISRFIYRLLKLAIGASSWDRSQRLLTEKLVAIVIAAIAIMIAIDIAGLDSTMLSIFSGTLGIGVGFGLKSIFSNLVSGLLLLMDRSIIPGDTIAVGDTVGEVQSVGVRAVSVITRDHKVFLIPNEKLVTDEVENWGYRSREVRERISVVVAYDSDFDLVEQLLTEAASTTERVLEDPAPAVRVVDFTSAGVQHELRFWIEDPEKGRANVKSIVYRKILDAFRAHRVEMPAPGLTLIEQRVKEEPPVD